MKWLAMALNSSPIYVPDLKTIINTNIYLLDVVIQLEQKEPLQAPEYTPLDE